MEDDTVCCYARSDKSWYADPDGNEWELYVNLGDEAVHSAPSAAAAPVPDAGGCCAPAPDGGSGCC